MSVSPPLDFSYHHIVTPAQLRQRSPRRGVKRYRRTQGGHYMCQALRLNNNDLTTLEGIHAAAYQILDNPEELTWLDLSFNSLTNLTPELCETFPRLKILYLHGNRLLNLDKLLTQLSSLTALYSLTLHGNPVQEWVGCKKLVLAALTGLRSLDFTNVTAAERRRDERGKRRRKGEV